MSDNKLFIKEEPELDSWQDIIRRDDSTKEKNSCKVKSVDDKNASCGCCKDHT